MTTEERRAELLAIVERERKATKGPWRQDPPWGLPWEVGTRTDFETDFTVATCDTSHAANCSRSNQSLGQDAHNDARFIAHARTDIPTLLALVREMREQLQAVYVCFDFNGKYKSCESIAALLAATEGV